MNLRNHIADTFLHLTNRGEKDRFLAKAGIKEEFGEEIADIKAIHEQTGYWHGLGRLRYPYKGENKWNGTDHNGEPVDILQNLLEEGLKPQHDFFHGLNNLETRTDTISTTPNRQYARAYASMYGETNKSGPEYTYSSRGFWAMYFLANSLVEGWKDIDFLKNEFRIKVLSSSTDPEREHRRNSVNHMLEQAPQWGAPSHKPKSRFLSNSAVLLATATSDIPNNHPLLIGIRKDAFQPVPMWRPFIAHEVRSASTITPDQWTCVEAPLVHVKAVREKIHALGIDIPVIPMEFAELNDSEKPFSELGKVRHPTEEELVLNHHQRQIT